MRKSRFSDEQIVAILHEADANPRGRPQKHGVSEQAIYTWRMRSGVMQSDHVKRLIARTWLEKGT